MHVQVVNYVIFDYSRPRPSEDTDDSVEELTTDGSPGTKPSRLSPEPQHEGIRIVDERQTTFRTPAAQGNGSKFSKYIHVDILKTFIVNS